MKITALILLSSCGVLLSAGGLGAKGVGTDVAPPPACPPGEAETTILGHKACYTPGVDRSVTIINHAGLTIHGDIGEVRGNATIAGSIDTKSLMLGQSMNDKVSSGIDLWVQADYWDTQHNTWMSVPGCRANPGQGTGSVTYTVSGASDGEQAGTSKTMKCTLN